MKKITTYEMDLTALICCVIITPHIRNSYTTYEYTTQHMK